MDDLKKLIREVPNFPKPGILFYDITTLLKDKIGLRTVIDRLTELVAPRNRTSLSASRPAGSFLLRLWLITLGPGSFPCESRTSFRLPPKDQL